MQRWKEREIAVDDLAALVDEHAAVAWDRDVAIRVDIPVNDGPRLYDWAANRISKYAKPCIVFGRPMGYWTAVAAWLANDKRWDVRKRRQHLVVDGIGMRRTLEEHLNDDTWIRICTERTCEPCSW